MILITGASGVIGQYLLKNLNDVTGLYHDDCDLAVWKDVEKLDLDIEAIIHCANSGTYGRDYPGSVEKNIAMFVNLRRKFPNARIIAFGSGAMYDKSKPIVRAWENDDVVYPKDLYGLSKRLTVDLADVTLIPFGLYTDIRFISLAKQCIKRGEPVPIIQDVKFSWTTMEYLLDNVKWALRRGEGRYNLCEFDMTLTEVAKKLGAKEITYLREGMANEYTGSSRLR
ncbi:NAD(P)-dependent oxidoreductase [Patescibacteria group bacterium]|nr:NAD(P)-dependent oxidoreductase [Patescibacteria group bacterium]